VLSNPDLSPNKGKSQNPQPSSPTFYSTLLLERLQIRRSLATLGSSSTGEVPQSPAAISIVSTNEEMTLLHPSHHLTNTPTDDKEEEVLPRGWTRQIWLPEQVEGVAYLCWAILCYR
jgi:hypothetical protein